jgi:hypothetical protein
MIINNFVIYLLAILNLICFILGFFTARLVGFGGVSYSSQATIGVHGKNKEKLTNSVSIDDSKYITSIDTQYLEKKYTSIAEEKKSEENIGASVSKLKQMKG